MSAGPLAEPAGAASPRRLVAIDVARGVAIVAMVIYHTAFDLSVYRLIPIDVVDSLGWTIFARLIAGSFLGIVGISLVLAAASGFRMQSYLRRLGFVVAGAIAVSLATWWLEPESFVYFGILHQIALASVLALPFLRLPWWLSTLLAIVVLAAPTLLAGPFFDAPALAWLGLSVEPRPSVDFVPVLPWFGVVLAGVAAGHFVVAHRERIARWQPGNWLTNALSFAGRWSLVIYLVHQPVLFGLATFAANMLPPNRDVVGANYTAECRAACSSEGGDEKTCAPLCTCIFDGLWGTDLMGASSLAALTDDQSLRYSALIDACRRKLPAD